MKKDLYNILGVDKNASQEDIKKAYRKLSKQYHPDINKEKGAEEKFKEINHANSVLSDPQKRKNYDTYGSEDKPNHGFGGFSHEMNQDDLMRMAEEMARQSGFGGFGGFSGFSHSSRNASRPQRGEDIEVSVNLDLEQAIKGCNKKINIRKKCKCNKCNGEGTKDGYKKSEFICKACNGSGKIMKTMQRGNMIMQQVQNCTCNNGYSIPHNKWCSECNGKGQSVINEDVLVDIPAGIPNTATIRLNGGGEGVNGGPNGYILLTVNYNKHSLFNFDNEGNLEIEYYLTYLQAYNGCKVEIPHPSGNSLFITVDPKSCDFRIVRQGQGYTISNGRESYKGDYIIKFNIMPPSKLEVEQIKILESFGEYNKSKNAKLEEYIKKGK